MNSKNSKKKSLTQLFYVENIKHEKNEEICRYYNIELLTWNSSDVSGMKLIRNGILSGIPSIGMAKLFLHFYVESESKY